ncbi:asparagine synthetase B family protein [Sphaerisporangium perillae]|uniref:asparagine synthetase B family protein n=1 Tax=Sphaerisporangium perillae TaxID=2935860 RepID=UPI00200C3236|nr:asparagine synthetase B family protein [Sphaerisporangium perillae]
MVDRLLSASPRGLDEVHRSPLAALWSTGEPENWTAGPRSGYLWWPVAGGLPQPHSWQDAAERRLAAGLVIDRQGAVLHTDALGLNDMNVRLLGDALYFSARLDPLVRLDDAPLHIDWSAWANLLVMTTPLADETPFREIRHLAPATAWRAAPGGPDRLRVERFEPAWLAAEPDKPPSPEDMVDLIAQRIPHRAGPVAIGLSGGWDSRLLAALAVRRPGSQVEAWTTSTDDGLDLDISCARTVAAALGVPHHVVVPGPESWLEEHRQVWRRTQYQTLHHGWAMPYARAAHRLRAPLIDGCLGDGLLRTRGDHRDVMGAASPEQARTITWRTLSTHFPRQPEVWAPGVGDALADLSLAAFHRVTRPVDGHHAMPILARLLTRYRGIYSSPNWLLGPEAELWLPFADPDVVTAALSVPLAAREDHAYYLAMLGSGSPELASLPSTNDAGDQPAPGPRRATTPAALAALAESISGRDEVRALLGPRLLATLTDPGLRARQAQWSGPLYVLRWASMLARWCEEYGSRVAWEPVI